MTDALLNAFHCILERGGASRNLTFAPDDEETLVAAFSRIGRFIEAEPPRITAGEREILEAAGIRDLSVWRQIDMARVCLLIAYMDRTREDRHAALVQRLFREGDLTEREALLRGLCLLPAPRRFLDTAIEAHRVAIQSVFEALACENSYPATHFPEPAFNQLVAKALFLGVRLQRIWGLGVRLNGELVRMAKAYASEREAAGRPIPQDIYSITQPISHGVH